MTTDRLEKEFALDRGQGADVTGRWTYRKERRQVAFLRKQSLTNPFHSPSPRHSKHVHPSVTHLCGGKVCPPLASEG